MQYALALDSEKQSLDPCHPARAWTLLRAGKAVVFCHREAAIHDVLKKRRGRKCHYHSARFSNRCRPKGWLPSSLVSRLANILTWTKRLSCWSPLTTLTREVVKFDTQATQNPQNMRVEYQQVEPAGYKVREFMRERLKRRCACCYAFGSSAAPILLPPLDGRPL